MTLALDEKPFCGLSDPRFESVPLSVASLGDAAVDFAAAAGLFADPWQVRVLRGGMGVKPDRRWAARQVGVLVPRQNGKGTVLEIRELYAMFVGEERLIIHSAHRYDTSQDHFRRMCALIEGNPDLDRHVKSVSKVIGKESITLRSGCQLKFKARTLSGSGRGFSCDLLVLDESFLLPEAALAAMLPTLSARPNPQTWFTSSAGMADSDALWRVVKRGRAGEPNLAYFEWGVGSGVDVSDREVWRSVNPGRVTMDVLEDDYALMTPEDFAREHLGAWDDARDDWVIPRPVWDLLADNSLEPPRPAGKVAFAVDVRPDLSRASVAVAGGLEGGARQVQVIDNRAGTAWIPERLQDLTGRYESYGVVIDSAGAARAIIDQVEAAAIPVIEMGFTEAKEAFGQFYESAVDARTVRHLNQPELNAALKGATTRMSGDALLWDRKNTTVDITPLVAVTLALWGWTTRHGTGDPLGAFY
jgi:phage terminase large subunit-like protein